MWRKLEREREREKYIYKYIITYKINLDNDNGVEVSVGRDTLDLLSRERIIMAFTCCFFFRLGSSLF